MGRGTEAPSKRSWKRYLQLVKRESILYELKNLNNLHSEITMKVICSNIELHTVDSFSSNVNPKML